MVSSSWVMTTSAMPLSGSFERWPCQRSPMFAVAVDANTRRRPQTAHAVARLCMACPSSMPPCRLMLSASPRPAPSPPGGPPLRRTLVRLAAVLLGVLTFAAPLRAAEPTVHVLLWFDTEDYVLPASDDAAKHLADLLTAEGVPATFKVVGEKARRLEQRGRKDVIAALQQHEIGYHSNYHSTQPTPAMYLRDLGWTDGIAEFDRRE